MFAPPLLLSALFAAAPDAGAPSPPPDCQAAPPALELRAGPGARPVLCVSPELVTTLLLDTPLPPGAVQVQAAEEEMLLVQAPRVITLVPSARMVPGEWRKLTVRFADGAAPRESQRDCGTC